MALSDYERRVLDEIEAELRLRPGRKWRPGRTLLLLAVCVIIAAGLMTLAALVFPAGADVGMAAVVGVVLGCLIATFWRRRRR
jgi:Flp pilus assembly protein TadB